MTHVSANPTFGCMREKELRAAARQAQAEARPLLMDLDERSRAVFREIVDSYLATGEPVGSRNISRQLPMTLSPASLNS